MVQMDIVNEILTKSVAESEIAAKSISVEKKLDVKIDLGTLLLVDENEVELKKEVDSSNYLNKLARDNAQLLINKIWTLPTEKKDDVIVVNLPKSITILPRAQPVPKPKPLTKWEQFAKEKGIQKKKKDKQKWDDILQKWVPSFGYKKAQADQEKDWVLEVPGNADPYEDQFEKKISERSERVAKNEYQRLRNLAKSKNIKVPKVGLTTKPKSSADDLGAAITLAKASTASLGKFQAKLPKEKTAKNVKDMLPGTNKRKLPPLDSKSEQEKNKQLIEAVLNKKPKLNIEKAVEKEVHSINAEENKKKGASSRQKKKKSGGRTKTGAKGGKYRGSQKLVSAKAGKGGGEMMKKKGQRVGGKIKGGRKRR